jgi:hypothetical protein
MKSRLPPQKKVSTREHDTDAKANMNAKLIIFAFPDIFLNKSYKKTRSMAAKQRKMACVQNPIPRLNNSLTYE